MHYSTPRGLLQLLEDTQSESERTNQVEAEDMAVIDASAFPYGDPEETPTMRDETRRRRRGCVKERAAVGLALYRSGARAALEAAINSVQAMVDDSAPLPDAHKAVSLYYVAS